MATDNLSIERVTLWGYARVGKSRSFSMYGGPGISHGGPGISHGGLCISRCMEVDLMANV